MVRHLIEKDLFSTADVNHSYPGWNFSGRTAVISAGAQGIGRGIVERLSKAGANVVFGDIAVMEGRRLELALREAGGSVAFVEADFASPEAWLLLLDECSRHGWVPTLGVSNAGIGHYAPVEEIALEDYTRVEAVNQRSALLMAKTLTPGMKAAGGGDLVFIGSIMSEFGFVDYSLYGMTKSALLGLTRSLAIELAPSCIRVNCIQPGFVLGRLPGEFRGLLPEALWESCFEHFREKLFAAFAQLHPFPAGTRADEIAQLICFLASGVAPTMTGGSFRLDGGLSARFPSVGTASWLSESLCGEIEAWARQQTSISP